MSASSGQQQGVPIDSLAPEQLIALKQVTNRFPSSIGYVVLSCFFFR
jgi:hypothetical protein